MSFLRNALDALPAQNTVLETFDRHGERARVTTGGELAGAVARFRSQLSRADDGSNLVALLFKPEETIEFLAAAFAAMSEGRTIVPLYPSWPAETQLAYLEAYRLSTLIHGSSFNNRAANWQREGAYSGRMIPFVWPDGSEGPAERLDPPSIADDHPCARIFTSGTSGKLAKLTEITTENIDAAVRNIQDLDFLHPGMCLHCPLSASHIFAFVVILGFLNLRPRRVIFSDVQFLSRLSQSRTGKIDGMILVPIVINRMRAAFYETLTANLDSRTAPPELQGLSRLSLKSRQRLKALVLRAEEAMIRLEVDGRVGTRGWGAIQIARKLFGRMIRARLGSPRFIVVGGAKPNLCSMAFLEVMGIRCLQGWGMTETTGPLAVCSLRDRYRGAFGTCGRLFGDTRAYIDEGELVVTGPQVARGYHEVDGTFVPFNGKKKTGDEAEIDSRGRLKVLGKASDRITTANGLNYNPIPLEEELHSLDLEGLHAIEEAVVIGDGRPRLGAVFYVREGTKDQEEVRGYLANLVEGVNSGRSVDERIAAWAVSETPFRDSGVLGPSGKVIRRRVEERYGHIFEEEMELVG